MVQEDGAASGSAAAPRTEAEGENSRQVAAHESSLPTPPLLVARQSQQVEAAPQSKRLRTEDNACEPRCLLGYIRPVIVV